MGTKILALIAVVGFGISALGGTGQGEEPIQPVFRLDMTEIDGWDDGDRWWHFHRSADGELVLIGRGGPDGTAIASNDEGRTWHRWPDIHTWPAVDINTVTRRGNDLFFHPDAPDLRVYRSQDEGKTWDDGHQFMQWPKLVAIPNGPRANHPDERYRGKALLWTTASNRIVVTPEGHLMISIEFLLGGEGSGPELLGTLVSEDDGVTWRCYELFGPPQGYRDRPEGFGEPKPVLLSDGRMWMVFRTSLGHLWQAFSEDGGRTWGEPSSTGLVSPLGPLHAQRVPNNDAVVVVWNNSKPEAGNPWFPRAPMAFAVSHDHCKTWSRPVIITKGYGYMREMCFSDTEMFIIHEGPIPANLVIYDLKDVLALQPGNSLTN